MHHSVVQCCWIIIAFIICCWLSCSCCSARNFWCLISRSAAVFSRKKSTSGSMTFWRSSTFVWIAFLDLFKALHRFYPDIFCSLVVFELLFRCRFSLGYLLYQLTQWFFLRNSFTELPLLFLAYLFWITRAPSWKLNKNKADDLWANLACEYFCWMLGDPHFFRQITFFSDSFHYTKKQKQSVRGKF